MKAGISITAIVVTILNAIIVSYFWWEVVTVWGEGSAFRILVPFLGIIWGIISLLVAVWIFNLHNGKYQ